jgi:hypothetical protein
MKSALQLIGIAAAVVAVIVFVGWWEMFHWHECRMVGHSRLYCVMTHNS